MFHSIIVCLNEEIRTIGFLPHNWKPWLIVSLSQASRPFHSMQHLENNPCLSRLYLLLSWLLKLTFLSVTGSLKLLSCLWTTFDLWSSSQDLVFFLTALDGSFFPLLKILFKVTRKCNLFSVTVATFPKIQKYVYCCMGKSMELQLCKWLRSIINMLFKLWTAASY